MSHPDVGISRGRVVLLALIDGKPVLKDKMIVGLDDEEIAEQTARHMQFIP